MSAVAGIVRLDAGPAESSAVARMLDCVEHRGRDWRAVWADGSAAIGYRWRRTGRTQAVDHQPLVDGSGHATLAIVFDGRLDNRTDLASLLAIEHEPRVTDAAIVLAAYRRFGSDAVARLLGDFALAIWDASARRLVLARDPRGV